MREDKTRDPALPPMHEGPFGQGVGEACGIVYGSEPPCPLLLRAEGEDKTPRCPRHCREANRNVDAASALCAAFRMRGRRKCKTHGGKSRAGVLSAQFKHGRFSRFAPAARYADLLDHVSEGDILDQSDAINVLAARAAELYRNIDDRAPVAVTSALRKLIGQLRAGMGDGATNAALDTLVSMEELLDSADRDTRAWEEFRETIRDHSRAIESQRKRDVEGGKFVTAEEALEMVNSMGLALKASVERLLPKEQADALLTDVSSTWAEMTGADVDRTGASDVAS